MNGREYIITTLGVLALFAALYTCAPKPEPIRTKEVVTDTVYEVVHRPPIVIAGRATRIVRRDTIHDTAFVPVESPCAPYVATLDTIVSRDTLTVTFEHPRAHFTMMLRQRPDSVVKVFTTITNTVHKGPDAFASFGTHLGALLVGYGVGRLQR